MPPAQKNRVRVKPRFAVEAVSRHPRLGIDYNPVTHVFTDAYVNPRSYAITVEDFPGKTLAIDNSEPEQQRPGSGTHHPGSLTSIVWTVPRGRPAGGSASPASRTGSFPSDLARRASPRAQPPGW